MPASDAHREILLTGRFRHDRERVAKMGRYRMQKLEEVVLLLTRGDPLPKKLRNHKLHGVYKGCEECRLESDWLLIYKQTGSVILLVRTGRHTDLFGE